MFCTQLTPPAWAASSRQMTSTMPAKARNNKTPMWQTLLAVAFWVAVWQGLAVCIGHNGLFLATPLQTVQTLWRLLPTVDFWHRVGFSALRILTGFVLAVTVGLLLGACGARWRWFGTLVGPVMQLIRAMPVASFVILALLWVSGKNLSVIVSWKSGVSAEVIGLPDHSVGDALYRAKITISTPEVFAWTLVIVLLSATLSTLAAWALRRAKRALCGEVEG